MYLLYLLLRVTIPIANNLRFLLPYYDGHYYNSLHSQICTQLIPLSLLNFVFTKYHNFQYDISVKNRTNNLFSCAKSSLNEIILSSQKLRDDWSFEEQNCARGGWSCISNRIARECLPGNCSTFEDFGINPRLIQMQEETGDKSRETAARMFGGSWLSRSDVLFVIVNKRLIFAFLS